jgi:hypothetical protein
MAAEEQQDGQKTLVAFIVGLLIGGMLVWAFGGGEATAPDTTNNDDKNSAEVGDVSVEKADDTSVVSEVATENKTPALQVGEGAVVVADQKASATVALASATYPVSEGWIGVREYNNDQLGYILGVVRFSESQGLVPNEIVLQRPTTAGNRYAVVIYTENGDFDFSLADDVQIDTIFDTFIAQ